jgi:hypothetical protein
MTMWPFPEEGPSSEGRRRFPATDDPDVCLTYQVADALLRDGRTRHQRVTVRVHNRVVLLSGTVDRGFLKQAVGDTARDIPGVIDVCNAVRVTGDLSDRPDGADEFDSIVAGLRAENPPGAERILEPSGSVIAWSALAAVTWGFLTLLMVTSQWTAVALTCLIAVMVLAVAGRRRQQSSQ